MWGVISAALFLIVLPLSLKIDFLQNDDWVYYVIVKNFLAGDFNLHLVSAPTFYAQGFLGALFSALFGTGRLPVLTLIISVLCFYIFGCLVRKFFNKSLWESFILSALLFFNPLFVYSGLGFMTENYFLLFVLLSIYFILDFDRLHTWRTLLFVNISVALAFFIRQAGLVLPLAHGIYLLCGKKCKYAFIQLSFFALLFLYYLFIFPKTPEMQEKPFILRPFSEPDYTFALIYAIFIYMGAFVFPLFSSLIRRISIRKFLLLLGLAFGLYFVLNKFFVPDELFYGEFPYLDNVWERGGFFQRGILGTKYHFYGMYDLYKYWELIAKISISLLLAGLVFYYKKLLNFFSVLFVCYVGLLLVLEKVYDRYLLFLVPVFILFLLNLIKKFGVFTKIVLAFFLLFLIFLAYQFAFDFILTNGYVWHKSMELVEMGVSAEQIQGTNAWKLSYRNESRMYDYDFSYDSPKVNAVYTSEYMLLDSYKPIYPLNFFVNSRVYLYGRKN